MKNFLILFILATTLFSCSSNDDSGITPPKVLQKVVFYKNSPNQRQWNFTNGLLASITLADGTVAEEFTYDALKRVTKEVKYTAGVQTEVNIITYNVDNTIKSVNALPYTFNAATRTYLYTYGSNYTINCVVNENMLAVDFERGGVNPGEYHMTYNNGKMTSFEKVANGSTEIVKNFHFDTNEPSLGLVYSGVLAVARVKSLTDPGFFIDCQVSISQPNGFDKGPLDPYYYNYGMITNMDGSLLEYGIEVLDSSNNPVGFYSFADYYYE